MQINIIASLALLVYTKTRRSRFPLARATASGDMDDFGLRLEHVFDGN